MKNIIPAALAMIATAGPVMAHDGKLSSHAPEAAMVAVAVIATGYLVRRVFVRLNASKEAVGQ
jgi:exosortase/archaeosortase